MRYFVIFNLLLLLTVSSIAEEIYLRDVPEGHYAYDAVYDLIRRGVTGGFPDGTFRGKKLMSRYELASFLSKLERSFDKKRAAEEKLLEELKAEAALSKYQFEKAQKETQIAGALTGRWRAGQTESGRGMQADYRLKLSLIKNFNAAASLKLNMDPMDSGDNGLSRDLVREMLDIEGEVKVGGAVLKATAGPGEVVHADEGLFPTENKVRYRRPRRTFSVSAGFNRVDFSLECLSRSTDSSGLTGTAEVSSRISLNISPLKFTLNPRCFSGLDNTRDIYIDLSGELRLPKIFGAGILLSVAKSSDYPHGLFMRGTLDILERLKIIAQKVGAQYREKFSYGIFDVFDRNLPDGAANYGLELSVPFAESWFIEAKGDYTDPGSVMTSEIKLGRNLAGNAKVDFVYQQYQSTSLARAFGFEATCKF